MRRELGDGIELDDDVARIDVDAVHDYLAKESYWAKGRPRDVVERLIREAQRVVGIYHEGRGVRAVVDHLADELGAEPAPAIVRLRRSRERSPRDLYAAPESAP